MRAALILFTMLSMLAVFTPAFALDAPSLEFTVKNVGSSPASVSVSRSGLREPKAPIIKPVEPGGKATFSREETVHDPHEQFPHGWDVYVQSPGLEKCHEVIKLTRSGCVLQGSCGIQVESFEDCCYIMTIKPK